MKNSYRRVFEQINKRTEASYKRDIGEDEAWHVHESRLLEGYMNMNQDFKGTLPRGYENMKEYIEEVLAPKQGRAVGLEVGGTASRLFGDFKKGLFEKTAGVALHDVRDPGRINLDAERGHSVITADVFNEKGHKAIKRWLGPQKADLIIERMVAGVSSLPENNQLLHLFLDRYYQLLNEGGVMFVESPFYESVKNAATAINGLAELKRKYPELDISWRESMFTQDDPILTKLYIRIEKRPGAPKSLSLKKDRE